MNVLIRQELIIYSRACHCTFMEVKVVVVDNFSSIIFSPSLCIEKNSHFHTAIHRILQQYKVRVCVRECSRRVFAEGWARRKWLDFEGSLAEFSKVSALGNSYSNVNKKVTFENFYLMSEIAFPLQHTAL